MFSLPIAFAYPWILLGLISLPVIWWLLRLTPPRPQEETFPPTRILARLRQNEETPSNSPWWLTLLRLLLAACIILAMAGPVLNPEETRLKGEGPVLIIVDDGWASANAWDARMETALSLIREAEATGRSVILESTTGRDTWSGLPVTAKEARSLLEAAEPDPLPSSHTAAANRISTNAAAIKPGQVFWLSDGLARDGSETLVDTFSKLATPTELFLPELQSILAIGATENDPEALTGTVLRADDTSAQTLEIIALDDKGLTLARTITQFSEGEKQAEIIFDQPVELRNQFTRIIIDQHKSTAAVKLLDENNRRRLVGLISGETFDQAQPLLSPLYYISRALEPYSDIRRSDNANVESSVPDLINQGVSVIILADVGTMSEAAEAALNEWINRGGMLVRFSGPRLGASPQGDLLPVEIRPGDRNLGGALSWETPKPLAPFDRGSPFYGLEAPREVLVEKQLLALQSSTLDDKTWSRLEDGTPLVTAEKRGNGHLVLYHVGSDAEWSNLPLSGTFVEMLRRTVNLSQSGPGATNTQSGGAVQQISLPPFLLLNGHGELVQPDEVAKPLVLGTNSEIEISRDNPPGFYGNEDGLQALNLFDGNIELSQLSDQSFIENLEIRTYQIIEQFEFRTWLLAIAAFLLILDCLAILWMFGTLRRPAQFTKQAAVWATISIVSLTLIDINRVSAQETDFSAALETRLAYVITGVPEIDDISEAGLRGLTQFIGSRTALEPGEPIGVDISQDELAFYALIYWPVDPRAEVPSASTMARIDAFMKQGGSVLFDTKDQVTGVLGGSSNSPAAQTLQLILSSLDIPALEPVPPNHVLTKAFYLLDTFPGRYTGGDLWVEASQNQENRVVSVGDGVSSILITSNDFAGAWAVDSFFRPLLPTVPPDPNQRNYAYRVGVNLMMYALTGNYKSDQVHLPALLERLGQ
ncbi:MAG: DUF4159 domain-containing protein [Pseudomonadota bacterium]